ncbi:hypothetical protein [Dyadobacter sp. LHD-138]|uniref:hypothetical protein n=1 Tax=Dyadobacter sp. LHD-138 TaxID=3071413 RepID=UPI0027E1F7C9|nr:hypothetical protein [Dyadobacter sp. LHD-138]MDQ6482231.1 hypothetical protein [Dyadobacter sp. LHD-138]
MAPSSPVDGQMYYNTGTKTIYHYDSVAAAWKPLGSGTVVGGNGLLESTTGGIVTLSVNVDGATLEVVTDIVRVKDGGITAAKLATDSVTAIKILAGAVSFAKMQNINGMTIMGRTAAGLGVVSEISLINDSTLATATGSNLATAGSLKAYIDGLLAGLGKPMGPFDAAAATNLPGTALVKNGSFWRVTTAGTVQGLIMKPGDVLFADKDNPSPTVAADWFVIEGNADQATTTVMGWLMLATNVDVQTGSDPNKAVTPAGLSSRTATEIRTGLAKIATQALTDAGANDTDIVTPLKMAVYVASKISGGGYSAIIGDGTAVSFTITHGLNSKNVLAVVRKVSDGSEIMVDNRAASLTTLVITPIKPPAAGAWEVTILKK